MVGIRKAVWVIGIFVIYGAVVEAATPVNFTVNMVDAGQTVPVQFRAYIPDGVDRIHGLVFNLPGTAKDTRNVTTNGSWQSILPGMGFGIVGLRDTLGNTDVTYWGNTPAEGQANFQAVMDAVANATNHPEISNAPVVLDGLSKGAYAASYIALMVPDRTVGYVCDKGFGAAFVPNLDQTQLSKTVGLCIAGTADQTVFPALTDQAYVSARFDGAHVGLAMDWNIAHADTDPKIRYAFIAQAIRARYPTGQVPSLTPGQPLQLVSNISNPWLGQVNQLNLADDYVSSTYIPITWPKIAALSDTQSGLDPSADSWLPTKAMAMVYQAQNQGTFNSTTRPLQLSVLNAVNTSVNNGQAIDLGITLTGLTSNHIELYHNEDLIAVFNQSTGTQQFLYTPTENGLQTFEAIATYSVNGVDSFTSDFAVVGVSLPEPALALSVMAVGMMLGRRRIFQCPPGC
ncbi:MAG TPA: hypothetical protein VHS31_08785 [Tepidisphaeraceae bacterium]|jgi:hypothetical protein|nr:hypothetical protein [Tepidisphaeraceae bacterium]